MSSETERLTSKIEKYIGQIKEGHKVEHALRRLGQMNMTVELLTKTGVGKVLNRLSRNEESEHAALALSIVTRWKETATNHQERSPSPLPVIRIKREVKEEEPSPEYPGESSSHHRDNNNHHHHDRKRKVKEEEGVAGGSNGYHEEKREKKKSKPAAAPAGGSFLAALASGDGVKNKPKKLKSFDLSLDIDLNYRPMPSLNVGAKQAAKAEESFDPTQMFKPRVGLTKIFAGRKKANTLTEVPRLFDCCIRVLQNHINDIDSFGSIPYHIVKPILEKCTWHQLAAIERANPYLTEDTDELWELLIKKHHAGKPTKKHETWKEMFSRCEAESANRLKMLSDRISQTGSAAQDKVRKVVAITDIKMPRGSKRGAIIDMPSALQVSKARKEIFESGSKAQLCTINSSVQNRTSTLGASSHRKKELAVVVKAGPKKGHLMAKTLKMLGQKRK